MSWLWGNETNEQAQIVVSALQHELDDRDTKIRALEAALRREQNDFVATIACEIKELESRKTRIEIELNEVNTLIAEKHKLIMKNKTNTYQKSKIKVATNIPAVDTVSKEVKNVHEVKPGEGKLTIEDSKSVEDRSAPLMKPAKMIPPMCKELTKVAKRAPTVLFIIQRSTNSNTVVYAANITSNKTFNATKPLEVYWIMYEQDGAPREELNMIERNSAYGVSCRPAEEKGQYIASLSSLRDRECVLIIDENGNIQARTTINGKKGMVLRRVFVQMKSAWGIPTVDYAEIFGFDPVSLAAIYEKKYN